MTENLIKNLKDWYVPTKKIIERYPEQLITETDYRQRHRLFFDNNGKVLFVAHLDTVIEPKIMGLSKKRLYATGLDDRLGCMLAYTLGQKYQADILLTDDEESFQSTAQYHKCKDYNWIVEFDRRGNDVVTYGNNSPALLDALEKFWKIGVGSYSDICDLVTPICSFNLGIGYHLAHEQKSYVKLQQLREQIEKFGLFFDAYHDRQYLIADYDPADQVKYVDDPWRDDENLWSGLKDKYAVGYCSMCDSSANPVQHIYGYYLCRSCFSNMIYEYENAWDRN